MNRMPKTYKSLNLPSLTSEQIQRLEKLKKMKEEDINLDDCPEAEKGGFHHYYAQSLKMKKERVCTTMDADNVAWLKKDGKGYQTRLNAVVRWARLNNCPIEQFL